MASIVYYKAEQILQVLTWSMVNKGVETAFKAVSTKNDETDKDKSYVDQPARTITKCGSKGTNVLLTMPAYIGNYQISSDEQSQCTRSTLACKIVTSFLDNATHVPPLPKILANILLFNTQTGQLECIVDGTQITAWRTASASVVATKYIFFGADGDLRKPINVAIVGCGVQGVSHALGMCDTYNVVNLNLWNRTKSKADALAKLINEKYEHVNVSVCPDPAETVAIADIICVATYSPKSLIDLDMIKKDKVHINAVGAGQVHFGEVAQNIYDNAEIYIDSWANAKSELKDLKATIIGEVGEIINNGKCAANEGITIFQSMGMATEDATVAHAVVEAIEATSK